MLESAWRSGGLDDSHDGCDWPVLASVSRFLRSASLQNPIALARSRMAVGTSRFLLLPCLAPSGYTNPSITVERRHIEG